MRREKAKRKKARREKVRREKVRRKKARRRKCENVRREKARCNNMGRGRRAGTLVSIIGAALLLGALSLSLYHIYKNDRVRRESEELLSDLKDSMRETSEENGGSAGDTTGKNVGGGDEDGTDVSDWREDVAGILTIPSLKLELPVLDGWNYEKLKKAPCIQYGSIEDGRLVIAAHNYRHHFGKLSRLEKGDEVMFAGLDGRTVTYRVESVETIGKDGLQRIKESGYELVMYTCTLSGRERTAVFCHKM